MTTQSLASKMQRVPPEIRNLRAWLVWKYVPNSVPGKKPRKVPFYANGHVRGWPKGRPSDGIATEAQPNVQQGHALDVAALVTLDEALSVCSRRTLSGVGLAMHPSHGLVALDFDDCVVAGQVDPRVAAIVQGSYAELSPSGSGVRAFFRGSLQDAKDTGGDPAVEFFHAAGFVTITGDALPEWAEWCAAWGDSYIADMTPAVRSLYAERIEKAAGKQAQPYFFGGTPVNGGSASGGGSALAPWDSGLAGGASGVGGAGSLDFLAAIQPKVGWTLDDARELLKAVDPSSGRETWLNALMALHHEFDGSDAALDLADQWSSGALVGMPVANYSGRADIEGRWRSFGKRQSATPITARWLIRWKADSTAHEKYDAASEYRKLIAETSDEFGLRERVCSQIAKDERLGDMEREALAAVLKDKFTALGSKYPIAACRKLVEKRQPKKHGVHRDMPEWAKGWVYVTDDDKFFRVDSEEWLSMQGFNAKFNREMPVNENGEIVRSASWYVLEDLGLQSVTKAMYLPWGGPLFDLDGVQCVNTYRPSSVPEASGVISSGGRRAVDLVVQHIELLCGGRAKERDVLIAWMAHNVQQPGVKIRWAPLIKGVEGDGKSLIGTIMAAVMGRPNVRNISPKVLGTDFTGWAEGAAIGVLEEIKLTGHNRYDILNALKPFITNDSVEIHRKGVDPYDAVNTMNQIAFTNHSDALPLGDTDRRWFIVFTPFASRDEMAARLGVGDLRAYFSALHAAIESHRADLRQWLLEYALPAWFSRNGDAPSTEEKAMMVAMSVSDDESTAREIIERGAPGVTSTVLSSKCLVDAMGASEAIFTSSINRLLTKIGLVQLPQKVKWNGSAHRIWVRSGVPHDNNYVRAALDSTISQGSGLDDFFGLGTGLGT